jgi:hypothetical protein
MDPEEIARVAHEVNRAYCQALGDNSQPAWDDAPQWQREAAMMGVKLHTDNPDAGLQASHESWMAQKAAEGWTYGPEKKPELKQHPCMVPFDQLPQEQQAKDYIFRAVVHSLAGDVVRSYEARDTVNALRSLLRQCERMQEALESEGLWWHDDGPQSWARRVLERAGDGYGGGSEVWT